MERTIDNCSLIKVNVKNGRGKPNTECGKCYGYIRRNKIHQVCKKCKLLIKE